MIIRNLSFLASVCLGTALLVGCATTNRPTARAEEPDLSPIVGQAVTPAGHLVLACVRQALATNTYDMVGDDGDSRLIRFTCGGGEAEALFNALADRSANIGSEWQAGAVTYRSTERAARNLYGVDLCWRDAITYGDERATYACHFNLNLGGFIRD